MALSDKFFTMGGVCAIYNYTHICLFNDALYELFESLKKYSLFLRDHFLREGRKCQY